MHAISRALPTVEVAGPHEGRRCHALVVARDGRAPPRPIFPFEIIGIFDPDGPPPYTGPRGFRHNGTFLHFLHWVIALDGPQLDGVVGAAREIGDGLVQVLDGRADYMAHREPEAIDILGAFQVKGGKIVEGSYRATRTHRVLTERGLFELDHYLCECVLDRLAAQVAIEQKRGWPG